MSENFVLRSTPTSPFGRKVRMAIDALGLNNRITVTPADPLDEKDTLRQQNPLGKMPCLVTQDGSTIYDSGIIIEFLQDVAGTDRLLRLRGPERYRMLTQARLADGIMDASILVVYETRFRPDLPHSPRWLEHQRGRFIVGWPLSRRPHPMLPRPTLFRSACRARLVILIGGSRLTGAPPTLLWSIG
ncbi:MAG: glutathione S-transferase N-terminal domain-containing protein [Pseudolabrys sp.]